MHHATSFDIFGIVKRGRKAVPGATRRPRCPVVSRGKGVEPLSVGELLKSGKYLEAMEKALYTKLLDKLDADNWDDCGEIVRLLEGLSII